MSDNVNYNLKPCPFCGGEAELKRYVGIGLVCQAYVECQGCHCRTDMIDPSLKYCANDEVVEMWNRRNADGMKIARVKEATHD